MFFPVACPPPVEDDDPPDFGGDAAVVLEVLAYVLFIAQTLLFEKDFERCNTQNMPS